MKKVLLGATALSLVGLAGAASAQEWSVRTGGFMTAGIGYVDSDLHNAEIEIVNNAEVIFNFTLVADNGIKFGGKVEFEANGSSENADEYVATASGSFGAIEIGREDGAGDRLLGAAAGSTSFTAAADEAGLLFDYASAESAGVVVTDGADTGDDIKITYFTPSFSGFKAGVSYTPGQGGSGGTSTVGNNVLPPVGNGDNSREGFELGAQYKGSFNDVSVFVGANYIDFLSDEAAFDNSYAAVLNIGYAGFTVGGIYGQADANATGAEDRTGYGFGVNYETGPWLFGAQVAIGADDQEDITGYSIGVDYALAPGVTAGVVGEYAQNDQSGVTTNDDSFAVGVFTNFNF